MTDCLLTLGNVSCKGVTIFSSTRMPPKSEYGYEFKRFYFSTAGVRVNLAAWQSLTTAYT